jgi:hypothetical protein
MTKIKDERLKISLYSFFECFRHTPKPYPKKMPKDFFIVNLIECTIQKKFFLHENLRYSIFKKKNNNPNSKNVRRYIIAMDQIKNLETEDSIKNFQTSTLTSTPPHPNPKHFNTVKEGTAQFNLSNDLNIAKGRKKGLGTRDNSRSIVINGKKGIKGLLGIGVGVGEGKDKFDTIDREYERKLESLLESEDKDFGLNLVNLAGGGNSFDF